MTYHFTPLQELPPQMAELASELITVCKPECKSLHGLLGFADLSSNTVPPRGVLDTKLSAIERERTMVYSWLRDEVGVSHATLELSHNKKLWSVLKAHMPHKRISKEKPTKIHLPTHLVRRRRKNERL
jgi:hypothetical protein